MAVIIPSVTNWSVTPQNGQENYFTLMNTWLSESTSVIASLNTAIVKINESNTESNDNLVEVINARNITVQARDEAVAAIATLSAGAIDNTNIATNKAFSNSYILSNYYNKTEIYNKTEVDNKTIINNFTDKTTPIDTDNFALQESGGIFKKLSWANLKATLLNYFDTFYSRTTAIFGIGQTWQNVTANRIKNTLYTNIETKPILVLIFVDIPPSTNVFLQVDGKNVCGANRGNIGMYPTLIALVPPNTTYKLTDATTIFSWYEFKV